MSPAASSRLLLHEDGSSDGLLSSVPYGGLLDGLNDRQVEAVVHDGGPLLVVAGPGSGKTRVLTHRVARILSDGVPPWAVLVVTFTNKAAGELSERLSSLVGDRASDIWVSTFHSACARILRRDGERLGLPRRFSILDTKDSTKVLRDLTGVGVEGLDPQELRSLRDEISRVKSHPDGVERLSSSSFQADRLFAETVVAYDEALRAIGAVDFDDLLVLTYRLLMSEPEVLERYQSRFSHVLVDEFQDTNAVQVELVELLSSPQNNVFVVGDTQQSIYSWRGAEPGVMHGFLGRYADAHTVLLDRNYRSTEAILSVVRAVVEPVRDHLVPQLVAASDEHNTGAPVRLFAARDDRDEASFVVSEICSSSTPAAVLMRTNAQSRPIEEALVSSGVSYQVVGALRFYDRAEVKDALSYLRLAANPNDRVAFERCVNTPRRGMGDKAVSAVVEASSAYGGDLVATVRDMASDMSTPARLRRAVGSFSAVMDAVSSALEVSPYAALTHVADCGLREALEADRSNVDRAENLEELLRSARQLQSSRKDLSGLELSAAFLENTSLLSAADIDDDPDADHAVQLLTVHAAKGREFPRVFVVGVEDGFFPHVRATSDADVGEERRLLFVACSRAERELTLSYARSRFMFNDRKERDPSPFLVSLPDSVVRMGSRAQAVDRGAGSFRARSSAARRPALGAQGRAAQGRDAHGASVPAPQLDPSDLPVGARVKHPRFGEGEVVSLAGDRVEVRFSSAVKVLDLAFAPLTLV